MAKRIKKVYNTKLLYRWSLPLWFTLLFILVGAAPLVVSCFFKVFTFNVGETAYEINIKDLVMNMFQQEVPVLQPLFSLIESFKGNESSMVIGWVLDICFRYVIPIFAILAAIFVFVLVIFFLVGLLSGRFHHWKGPFIIMMWNAILGLLCFGQIIGFSLFLNMQNQITEAGYKFDYLFAIIYAAVPFVAAIILGIIYAAGFKKREFIPNKEYLENYIQSVNHGMSQQTGYQPQPIIINNNPLPIQPQPAEQPAVYAQPVDDEVKPEVQTKVITKVRKVHETEVDQSLKNLGGHAYAKNIYIVKATIPEGIDKIGPSAFANCVNLKVVIIPASVKEIGYNAFFNCKSLEKVIYSGKKEQWRRIKRGSNWLSKAGTSIVSCIDGAIQVNPYRK